MKYKVKIILFLTVTTGFLSGCAKSTESDIDTAVQKHINAKFPAEAEDACRTVFLKAQKNKTTSNQLCTALKKRTDAELSICEDEIQGSDFLNLVTDCKTDLIVRIEKIKTDRNVGIQTGLKNLNFKMPFEIQSRDVSLGYTAVTGDTKDKQVILSFDDGPHPLSKNVVAMLDQIGVKAHFMQVGQHVQQYPEITKMIADRGHSIGNHSWDHSDFSKISFQEQIKQISDTNRIIINTIGWVDPFFRYPYGATTPEMNKFLKDHSEVNFLWSVDSNDWRKINADLSLRTNQQVIKETLEHLDQRGRGIVLFHDVHARTIELLPEFLIQLKIKGYTIVLLQASDSGLKNSPRVP